MPTKPQLPRPNTYIKIRDIEQLKLLCEYKNDEVCHDDDYSIEKEIKDFKDQYNYFVWHNDGKGCVRFETDEATELTDDSFLYPTKPMKEKKQKQEVFVNKFYVGQMVWFYYEDKATYGKILKISAYNTYGVSVFIYEKELGLSEDNMFKTKSQLIKSLSKQWREEVEERILNLNK